MDHVHARARDGAGDDETTAGITRRAVAREAEDRNQIRLTQLSRVGDDERTAADGQRTADRVGAGQDQRSVTRLDEALIAGERHGDDRPTTEANRDTGHGSRATVERSRKGHGRGAGDLVIRETCEIQSADRDRIGERDRRTGAREVRDIIGGKREVRRGVRAADRGRRAGVHPVRLAGARPCAGAAGAGDVAVGVPEQVGGAGGARCADGEERRGDHQRGARKEGTRLRTFH